MSGLQERAGEGVEPGREDHHVELVHHLGGADALGHELEDREGAHVGEAHVLAVEGLEIAAVDGRAAGREGVVLGHQLFAQGRIVDALADLAAHELGRRVVGRLRQQDVVVGEREAEAEAVVGRLVDPLALLLARIERGLPVGHEAEAGRRVAPLLAARAVIRLDARVLLLAHGRVGGGNRIVRRALEHGQVRGLLCDHRRHLHAGRAGADDGDALAGKADLVLGPHARMDDLALEGVLPRNVRPLRGGELPDAHHEEAGGPAPSVPGAHRPARGGLVVFGALHARVQFDMAAQIEPVRHMGDVAQDLGLRRIALAPAPFLLQLGREGVGIIEALDVAAGAGIAVVIPHAADIGGGFEHHDPLALLAQPVERAQARKARAHDGDIDGLGVLDGAHAPASQPATPAGLLRCWRER